MTKGRPFTDPTFSPGGRQFTDPTHQNYNKFRGWLTDLIDELEEEVEEKVEEVVDELEDEVEDVVDEVEEIVDDTVAPPQEDEEEVVDAVEDVIEEVEDLPTIDDITEETTEGFVARMMSLPEEELEVVEDSITGKLRIGTEGKDQLKGTNRDDILIGGAGADKFKPKKGMDTIFDFEAGVDSFKGRLKDVEVSIVDGGTLIDHKKGSILLDGLELTAADIFG